MPLCRHKHTQKCWHVLQCVLLTSVNIQVSSNAYALHFISSLHLEVHLSSFSLLSFKLLFDSTYHFCFSRRFIKYLHPYFLCIQLWFTNGVPRNTSVPHKGVKCASKFGITTFLLMFYYRECQKLSFLTQQGCRQGLKDAVNQKRLKNIGI
jgi:hypothetical protein